jgi:predicted NACHT family NTPase
MAAHFAAFIIEPFVEKKIGAGGRWGILLDGLDELEREDAQCQIIKLITAFVHEHRDTPLVWVIASRPEPHISNTFTDDANGSY